MTPEFTEAHSNQLFNSPWLGQVHEKTGYIFKYHASEENLSCCILITDLINVWTEVLESKQLARRGRQCVTNSPPHNGSHDKEISWREQLLSSVSVLHSAEVIKDAQFRVEESQYSDLEISIENNELSWRWDVISAGRMSPQLLFTHLTLPLMTLVSVTNAVEEPIKDIPIENLTKVVDAHARTTKVSPGRQIVTTTTKPLLSTILLRSTQIINGQKSLASLSPIASGPSSTAKPVSSPKRRSDQSAGVPLPKEDSGSNAARFLSEDETDEEESSPKKFHKLKKSEAAGNSSTHSRILSSPSPPSSKRLPTNVVDEEEEQAHEETRLAEIRRIKQGENNTETKTKSSGVFKPPTKKRRF
ncbi:hypothetical protein FRC02_004428 [Tulasnella sp. 418]|nr:hypothetical protein FRC02_004428 [Tulasnella sp. 418]